MCKDHNPISKRREGTRTALVCGIRKPSAGNWQTAWGLDETNAKLAHQVGELRNTSGKRNADIAIAIVGLPPVAVHAIRVEIAEIDEVAVRGTNISLYVFPSVATALHANGTCRACVNMCALRKSISPALEKRKQCI